MRIPTPNITAFDSSGPHGAPEIAHVLREADVTGRDLERPAEDELPDEEKGQQCAQARVPECFAKIEVGSAGAGHRRRQFAPDQAVADGEDSRRAAIRACIADRPWTR